MSLQDLQYALKALAEDDMQAAREGAEVTICEITFGIVTLTFDYKTDKYRVVKYTCKSEIIEARYEMVLNSLAAMYLVPGMTESAFAS